MNISTSAYIILGFVSKGPKSGYTIKHLMHKIGDVKWSISNAQIYPILKMLEQKNLVSSELDNDSGARKKRIYTITPLGEEVLDMWLLEETELSNYREEILLKLALSNRISQKQLRCKLETYIDKVSEKIQKIANVRQHINEQHDNRPDKPYLHMVYDHVEAIYQAKLTWAKNALATMEDIK